MRVRTRLLLIAVVTLAVVGAVWLHGPIPQEPGYHNFADRRALLGTPNCLNVISNLPFLLVGARGLLLVLRPRMGEAVFLTPGERWPYAALFLGVALTSFGSAYYHLAPDDGRLVWDRLPMALGFMALLSVTIAERLSLNGGLGSLLPLLALGLASVVQWNISGDLRFYLAVQFFTLLVIPLILCLFPPRYTRGADFVVAVGVYFLAKVLESLDEQVFGLGRVVSGHTLKHLTAAGAVYWILRMLGKRRPAVIARCAGSG